MGLVRLVSYLVWAVVFLILLLLAIKNAEPVILRFYFGLEWAAPLILVLLLAFAAGAVLGIIACLPTLVRQRREASGLRKELQISARSRREEPPEPALPDLPPPM